MSSSSRLKMNLPSRISPSIWPSPLRISSASALGMMFSMASMRTWARLPCRSSAARRLSKSIEGVISLMISAGPAENRPPHILLVFIVSPMTKTAKIVTVLAAIAAIASGFLYGKGLLNVHQAAVKPASLAVLALEKAPKAAPAVAFVDLKGSRHALAGFKGRYVLLNLWSTWCAPCVSELPALTRLKDQVPGLQVLAVDLTGHSATPAVSGGFL